uniref:Uncharacterized protein n=1 Tax=Oryza brachyantha TaxID=4533 RepID=J3L0L0_ORYBR
MATRLRPLGAASPAHRMPPSPPLLPDAVGAAAAVAVAALPPSDPPKQPEWTDEMTDEQHENLQWVYEEKLEVWKKSNRMSLMYIKSTIAPGIIGGIVDSEDAKRIWLILKRISNLHLKLMPIH